MSEDGKKAAGNNGRIEEGAGGSGPQVSFRGLSQLASMGISMVASTFIGLFIGIYLDKYFGTTPWLTVIFLIFGIAAGFKNIYAVVKKYGT